MSVDRDDRREEAFTSHATRILRDSAQNLDAASRSRLNRARQAALAELDMRSRRAVERWWVPAGAVALAALVAVSVWLGRGGDVITSVPVTAADADLRDFELLLDEDNLEMLEDLEFFAWLSLAEPEVGMEATG